MAKFKIEVTYKPGVLDAEGNAALEALKTLGFHVADVKTSKVYTVETPHDIKKVEEMCKKLLANPIIQDYFIKKL